MGKIMIEIRSPKNEDEFKKYYRLRHDVLAKPWNQPKSICRDALDETAFHISAYEKDEIVGCARLQINNDKEAQIRYMAVKNAYQNQGIGSLILKEADKIALSNNISFIILNARDNALRFYKKNGYKNIGKGELLWNTIPHWKMKKIINKKV